METRPTDRVYLLDLLRFFAAFGVMVYHFTYRAPMIDHMGGEPFPELDWWTRYLHLGVKLFFMISGFVICYSAEGRTALQFAWSRFVRLFPAYWFCVTLTFLVCYNFWQPYFQLGVKEWLVNLTMLQEYARVDHVDPPYWTLAEELRFYGLMFLLLLFRVSQHRLLFVSFWMLLSAVDYFIKVPLARYEMTLEHAPFFAAGMVFYDLFKRGPRVAHGLLLVVTFTIGLARFLRWSDDDGRVMHAECSPWVIGVILLGMYGLFLLMALRRISLLLSKRGNYSVSAGQSGPSIEYDPHPPGVPGRVSLAGWMPGLYAEGVVGLTLADVSVAFDRHQPQPYWGTVCLNTSAAGAPVTVLGGSCTLPAAVGDAGAGAAGGAVARAADGAPALPAAPTAVTISNTALRTTVSGATVLAQDGNLANALTPAGEFVLVGMSYGLCPYVGCANESLGACGFGAGRILVYTSPTLADGSWAEGVEECVESSVRRAQDHCA
jgi:peptidoglycan/LPS O-acetylase OafA/YrhL